MPFFKITFNNHGGMGRACVYNRGCNFRCKGCSYKLKPSMPMGMERGLGLDEIRETLMRLSPRRVHFLGGEPTTNPHLSELARFAHEELGAVTKVGHTNGSGRIPDHIDEASFSIKAYSCRIHKEYTGEPNEAVLRNFVDAHTRGITVVASSVLIPGIIGAGEVGRVARYVGGLDRGIKFHIIPYIPVPGAPYSAPSHTELREAFEISRRYVDKATIPLASFSNFAEFFRNDLRYQSVEVA